MNNHLSRYFSSGHFSRWPIWKVGVSALLAVVLSGTVLTTATGAAVQALAPKPTPTPEPTPEPIVMQEHLDTGWLKVEWEESEITPARKPASYWAAADLSARQQDLYIEVYATNVVTHKTTRVKDVPMQVVLSCAELFKVEHKENKYKNPASELNATTVYDLDTKTGKLKIEKLNPGKYAVKLKTEDGRYTTSKPQYVTVKERVDYKKDDTTAKQETESDAKEDQKPTKPQGGGGEEIVITPVKTGVGFWLEDTPTWSIPGGDAKYLYAADGKTKLPYRVETRDATGAEGKTDGKKIKVLDKAVFDKNANEYLYSPKATEQPAETAAAAAEGTAAVFAADPLRMPAGRKLGITLLTETDSQPAPVPEGEPVPDADPESPAPEASPEATPAVTPSETPVTTPTPENTPAASPENTPTASPAETPAASPENTPTSSPAETPAASPENTPTGSPTVTPSVTPTTTPTTTPKPTDTPAPTPVPVASYVLFGEAGAPVENAVFKLPKPVKIVLNEKQPSAGKVMGIDVSKYQPNINWKEVKESGVDFVIIRMGYRGYGSGKIVEDPYFRKHLQGAKAAGLKVGIYFFSQAIDEKEAVEEASACLNAIAGQKLDYPIFFDSEYSTSSKTGRADGLTKGERTACAIAFCETIRNAGYRAGVYASTSWFNHQLSYSSLTNYTIWNAHYGVSASPIHCQIWQYTGNGRVKGVYNSKGELTAVDVNESYMG